MTNLTIVTPMRDCAAIMPAYVQRVTGLDWPADQLRVVISEGDSVDMTKSLLRLWMASECCRVTVVTADTGKPRYGSVVDPERFRILATVFNAGLDAVDLEWTDCVLFLPADIMIEPDLARRLVASASSATGAHILAPFVWMGGQFYDVWAFTRNGQPFAPFRLHVAASFGPDPVPMDTVGGTMLIHGDVLRAGVRYTEDEVDRGFCHAARAQGFGVFADPTINVYHPRPE